MRYLSLVLSAVWIGGLAILGGVVGTAVFDVLQMHDPASGRILAGELFGTILTRAIRVLLAVGVLQVVLLGVRAALGPRPRRFKGQTGILLLMIGLTAYVGYVISPRIDAIRTSSPVPIATLPTDSVLRQEFGRLHGLSVGFLGLALVGALSVVWFERRE